MRNLYKLKNHLQETNLYINRVVHATVICFLLLLIKLIYMQVFQHNKYKTLAHNNQVRITPMAAPRGLIYDRNGILLAENTPVFSLKILPYKIKNLNETLKKLGKIINLSDNQIKNFYKQIKYKGKYEEIPIRNKLSEHEVAKFSVVKHQFPHVDITASLSRYYPLSSYTAHTVGYIGQINENDLANIDIKQYRGVDQIGKAGIEKSFENILLGKVGYRHVETDARGRTIRILKETLPTQGNNIYLTIDAELQQQAYQALNETSGAIVIIDIKSGEILSLVSNNILVNAELNPEVYNNIRRSNQQPLFNRAISGQYSPGSIVKPIIALQALNNKLINNKTKIFEPGFYQLGGEKGKLFYNFKKAHFGYIDLNEAIARSSCSYFYHIADKLGIDQLYNIFNQFHLGQPLGIEISGEKPGLIPSSSWKKIVKQKPWYPGETLITGIGQGYLLVTPLQVAQIAAIIANQGVIIKPTIFKSINNNIKPKPNILSIINLEQQLYWQHVTTAMQQTVSNPKGTAHYIHNPNTPSIAAKTGTAQVFSLKKEDNYVEITQQKKSLRDHSWFMAFAPSDKPEIAIAVISEHTKGSPKIASKLINFYFSQQLKNKTIQSSQS